MFNEERPKFHFDISVLNPKAYPRYPVSNLGMEPFAQSQKSAVNEYLVT